MQNRYRLWMLLLVTIAAMGALLANTSPDEPAAGVSPPVIAPPAALPTVQSSPVKAKPPAATPVITDPPMERDQMLYENHCTACHSSQAYIRQQRKARSLADIRRWVQRWSTELKLDWGATDVELVSQYLNRNFYHFNSDEESRNEIRNQQ
jgi:cytochrome c5